MRTRHELGPIFAVKLADMELDQQQYGVEQVHGVLPLFTSILGFVRVGLRTRLLKGFEVVVYEAEGFSTLCNQAATDSPPRSNQP